MIASSFRAALTLAAIAFVMPAAAQEAGPVDREAGAGIAVSASATATSDYRFRGISRSDGDPALQGQAYVDIGDSGLYAGVWGSTLGGSDAGDVEIDLIAGFETRIASGASLDVGAIYYAFPGDRDAVTPGSLDALDGYVEPYASLGYTLGPVEAKLGAAYAPDQDAIGGDNLYVYGQASAGIPLTPLTVTAKLGRSDGALAPGSASYFDWSLGADFVIGPVTLGAKYVDTDIARTGVKAIDQRFDPNVVVSASIGF